MARNESESKMRSNTEYEQSINKEVDAAMLEMQRKKRRRELDRQVNTLAERAIYFEDQYGSEDYRTQIMVMFLDVTLQMKSAIDLLSDVGVALQCIGQAIGCIDDVLNMQQEMLSGSLEQKYGFRERAKRRRQLKRAMNNNTARMQQMCEMLVGSQKMAMSVVNALRKSLVKMKATTEKNFEKQNKRQQGAAGAQQEASLAKKLMDELRGNEGGAGGSSTPSASGSSSGSSSGGTDDISDIL